jgi:hypothetical protein
MTKGSLVDIMLELDQLANRDPDHPVARAWKVLGEADLKGRCPHCGHEFSPDELAAISPRLITERELRERVEVLYLQAYPDIQEDD